MEKGQRLSGFYKMSDGSYFLITANLDVYEVKKLQATFTRDYAGNVNDWDYEYTAKDKRFVSGDFDGKRMNYAGDDVPAQFTIINAINSAALGIMEEYNKEGISIEVVLRNSELSFADNQPELVAELKGRAAAVKSLLSENEYEGVTKIVVNDANNDDTYVKGNPAAFHIPADLDFTAEEFGKKIDDKTLQINDFR